MPDKNDRSEPARRKPGRHNVLGGEVASAKALRGRGGGLEGEKLSAVL